MAMQSGSRHNTTARTPTIASAAGPDWEAIRPSSGQPTYLVTASRRGRRIADSRHGRERWGHCTRGSEEDEPPVAVRPKPTTSTAVRDGWRQHIVR